jgi:hypothetical protein
MNEFTVIFGALQFLLGLHSNNTDPTVATTAQGHLSKIQSFFGDLTEGLEVLQAAAPVVAALVQPAAPAVPAPVTEPAPTAAPAPAAQAPEPAVPAVPAVPAAE